MFRLTLVFLFVLFSSNTILAVQHGLHGGHRSAHGRVGKRDSLPAGYGSPPYYPTPQGGWVSSWTEAYAKAQRVVSNMTLAEKVNLTTGTGLYMVSRAV